MFNTPTGRYLSTAQAGEFLGVTPSRIHRLVRDGFLEVKDTRFYKFGKNYYFDRTDVERLLPRIPEIKENGRRKRTPAWRKGLLSKVECRKKSPGISARQGTVLFIPGALPGKVCNFA